MLCENSFHSHLSHAIVFSRSAATHHKWNIIIPACPDPLYLFFFSSKEFRSALEQQKMQADNHHEGDVFPPPYSVAAGSSSSHWYFISGQEGHLHSRDNVSDFWFPAIRGVHVLILHSPMQIILLLQPDLPDWSWRETMRPQQKLLLSGIHAQSQEGWVSHGVRALLAHDLLRQATQERILRSSLRCQKKIKTMKAHCAFYKVEDSRHNYSFTILNLCPAYPNQQDL